MTIGSLDKILVADAYEKVRGAEDQSRILRLCNLRSIIVMGMKN